MKKTILMLLTGAAIFTSCKNDDDDASTASKVLGKWALVTTVNNSVYNGVPNTYTYTGTANDFVDFRNDGKVYSKVQGSADTVVYKVINDTHIVIDGDTTQIKTLTGNSFVLYSKDVYTGGYDESTITLKK